MSRFMKQFFQRYAWKICLILFSCSLGALTTVKQMENHMRIVDKAAKEGFVDEKSMLGTLRKLEKIAKGEKIKGNTRTAQALTAHINGNLTQLSHRLEKNPKLSHFHHMQIGLVPGQVVSAQKSAIMTPKPQPPRKASGLENPRSQSRNVRSGSARKALRDTDGIVARALQQFEKSGYAADVQTKRSLPAPRKRMAPGYDTDDVVKNARRNYARRPTSSFYGRRNTGPLPKPRRLTSGSDQPANMPVPGSTEWGGRNLKNPSGAEIVTNALVSKHIDRTLQSHFPY